MCREIEILHPVDKLGRWGERPTNLKHLSKEEQREFKHIDFERPPTPPPQTSEIDTIICRMRGIHPEPVLVPQKEETINLDPGIPCPPGAYVPPPVPYTLALVSCNDMVVTPASTCFCLLGAGGCLRRGGRQAAAQKSTLTTAESGKREPCLAKACTRTFIVTWGGSPRSATPTQQRSHNVQRRCGRHACVLPPRFALMGTYDGQWEKGRQNGIAKATYMNECVHEGMWKDGKMNGSGKITYVPLV